MKVKCPGCEERFDVDKNEYDEDDVLDCPECEETLILKVKGGKFVAKLDKEKYDEDLEDYYNEEDE